MEPWTLENGVPSGEIGTFHIFFSLSSIEGKISAVYEDNAIGESTARIWFSRFKEDRFDIK